MAVAGDGRVEICRFLISHGAEATDRMKGGWTTFYYEYLREQTEVLNFFVGLPGIQLDIFVARHNEKARSSCRCKLVQR
jgi:hypothetical protein